MDRQELGWGGGAVFTALDFKQGSQELWCISESSVQEGSRNVSLSYSVTDMVTPRRPTGCTSFPAPPRNNS